MRAAVFVLAVFAASASAVSMRLATSLSLAKAAGNSAVGQTILVELQDKLAQGAPMDELTAIIEQVTQRILDADAADKKQHDQRQVNCTIAIQQYEANIAEAKANIAKTKAYINQLEAKYNNLKTDIKQLEADIVELTATINQLMDEIETHRAKRAQEHAVFVSRTTDTTAVIAAVEEIRGLEVGSTLQQAFPDADLQHIQEVREHEAHRDAQSSKTGTGAFNDQDRVNRDANDAAHASATDELKSTTTHVETDRFGENIGNEEMDDADRDKYNLLALAQKVTDPQARSYLQVAADAVKSLGDDDVKKLLDLLDELLEELRSYTDQLILDEKTKALDWARMESSLTEQLRSKQNTKHGKQDALEAKYSEKRQTAAEIHNQRLALDEYKQALLDNEQLLRDKIAYCDDLRKQFERRTADRAEEMDTLSKISAIVKAKLNKAVYGDNSGVATRISGVTVKE